MHVTVLGKSPSWQDAGGACSGYLVQEGEFTLMLDCGTGVFAKLRAAADPFAVDAVLITHLHSDHFFDLVPFSYCLMHSPRRPAAGRRPALHAPPGAAAVLRAMVGAWGEAELIETAFELHEYDPAAELALGPLRAQPREVPHFTRTFAVSFRGEAGTRFVFGADCGPNEEIVTLASGSDLLMLEATLPEPDSSDRPGHLSAAQAGDLGRRAGVRQLVLTHYTDELDVEELATAASRAFGGPVSMATEGAVYRL